MIYNSTVDWWPTILSGPPESRRRMECNPPPPSSSFAPLSYHGNATRAHYKKNKNTWSRNDSMPFVLPLSTGCNRRQGNRNFSAWLVTQTSTMNAADVHLEFSITERYVYIDDRIQCERGTPYKKKKKSLGYRQGRSIESNRLRSSIGRKKQTWIENC
jgi:hypothetical protein